MRAAGYVLSLAWRRVARSSSGALLAGAGIAVGAALLAALLVGTTVAQDRSIAQAIERLPLESRAVRAVWFGVPVGSDESYAVSSRAARRELASLGAGPANALVLFRESTVAGRFVSLAAADGAGRFVSLLSGRLPRPCTAARCEVLRLRGAGPLPSAPGLRLVEVGRARLGSRLLFGDFLAPTDNALANREVAPAFQTAAGYHRPQPAPLVLADGVAALAAAPALAATYRSYAWVVPLRPGTPRLWEIGSLARGIDRARAALAARSASFSVQAPVAELRASEQTAAVAGRRLLLVGGEAAALLFGFALLAARSMRRDLDLARLRLTWYGARRWQLSALVATESATVAIGGTIAGWLAGLAAGAAAARLSGAPALDVVRVSALTPGRLGLMAAVAASAAVVLLLAVSMRPRRPSDAGPSRLGPLDAAALAATALVAVALASGAVTEARLARDDRAGLLLLALPGLVAFVAAVVAARMLAPAARAAARAWRHRPAARVGVASLGRGPATAPATAGFLVVAVALAGLAAGYRATLARAEADQAAYRVPLDVLVREDLRRLVPVLDAAPLARFGGLGGGTGAVPVLRLSAGAGAAEGISGVTVLGLPPATLPLLHGWREDWASLPPSGLAAAISPPRPVRLAGARLGSELVLHAGPGLVTLLATVVAPDGSYAELPLGTLSPRTPTTLRTHVPASLRGGTLVALELVPPRLQERGADAGRALRGVLRLAGPPLAGWTGESGVEARRAGRGVLLRYAITPQRTARLRAQQATDARPPEVLVTPRLAALAGGPGGVLPLQIGGERIPVRVAQVVQRFPGVSGEAVVGDLRTLELAIDTRAPGAARTNEVWLEVPAGRRDAVLAALARPPFRALESISRASLEADARADPIAHGTLLALATAALVALLLAAAGLVLTVRSDLRDEAGELYDLEAQGAAPSLLLRIVRGRALAVALLGLVAGAATGVMLTLLVSRMVSVTARATAPEPPLATAFDPGLLAIGAAVFLAVSIALVALSTRAAFAGARGPARTGEQV